MSRSLGHRHTVLAGGSASLLWSVAASATYVIFPFMRGIIFDLDNCLAPADEPGRQLLEPVFSAIRAANEGTLAPDALEAALEECWFHPLDTVAAKHDFSDAMRAAGWRAYREVEVREPMRGYGDLDVLPRLGELRFLVTSGFRRLQESKVRALGISSHFAAVVIDAVDDGGRRGKERIFAELMARFHLAPKEVLVVGDDAESELAAATRLGLRSVQILRPGVMPAPEAQARVRGLAELRALLDSAHA